MIITDRFVVLNYPRTGSTFVRKAFAELARRRSTVWSRIATRLRMRAPAFRELLLPILRTDSAAREKRRSQHGAYSQIPTAHRNKIVVSVARHPLDRAVSLFEHGFWRDQPPADPGVVREQLPAFPDLDFAGYLELQRRFDLPNVLRGVPLRAHVGPQTIHFVRFYHPDPDDALRRMTDATVDDGSLMAELPEIRFLHTERLVDELIALLRDAGFGADETGFVRDLGMVNAAPSRKERGWRTYFTEELEARYRHEERFLFQALPEYAGE